LGTALVGARAVAHPAQVELIRPGDQQIARFRGLRFGDEVEAPHYRPVPTHHRLGAYNDPFYYYYYDPYYDFMSWVMIDSMLHHHHHYWDSPHVHVYEPSGAELSASSLGDGWGGSDAVSFDDGQLSVDSSIPDHDDRHSLFGGDATASSDSSSG